MKRQAFLRENKVTVNST